MTVSCRSPREGSSPHTRGALSRTRQGHRRGRIIPAYAGSTPTASGTTLGGTDHPRIRGEHPPSGLWCPGRRGSSPHTRGAHHRQHWDGYRMGIIPAYAGSTSSKSAPTFQRRDHPRIRGEHAPSARRSSSRDGSSPHTRGARIEESFVSGEFRIIPAYAGSTDGRRVAGPLARDHPRIRGEHGLDEFAQVLGQWIIPAYAGSTDQPPAPALAGDGSSPHTRGALSAGGGRGAGRRIIPAYAGSTNGPSSRPPPATDHPRIRGEHKNASKL